MAIEQGVEKRHERRPDKAKFGENAEFICINECFESKLTQCGQAH